MVDEGQPAESPKANTENSRLLQWADGMPANPTDDKRVARLNVIKDMLHRLHYAGKDDSLVQPQADIVFPYDEMHLDSGAIAK